MASAREPPKLSMIALRPSRRGRLGPIGGRQRSVDEAARPLNLSRREGGPAAAAPRRLPRACSVSLSLAARSNAVAADACPPRSCETLADASSSAAISSSAPMVAIDWCQTRRSVCVSRRAGFGQGGMSASTVVERGRFVHRRADQRVAEAKPLRDDGTTSPSCSAASSASSDARPSSRAACRTALGAHRCLCCGEQQSRLRVRRACRWTRRRNAACRRAVSGIASGSRRVPGQLLVGEAGGSSSKASGFPAASSSSRSRTGGRPLGRRTRAAHPPARDPAARGRSRRPGVWNVRRSPSRTANRRTIPSAASRRAVNISASADGTSSHCASSIRHTTGRSSAAAASSESTPAEIRKRSDPSGGPRPSAAANASRCGAGSSSRWPTTGQRRPCNPEKSRSDSSSMPVTAAPASRSRVGRVAEQRRLADAGLPAQHERAALATCRRCEQSVDQRALSSATDEPRSPPARVRTTHQTKSWRTRRWTRSPPLSVLSRSWSITAQTRSRPTSPATR